MNLDKISQDHQLEGFCRGCLFKYDNPTDLLQYTEKNRRLFVYSTGLQVKRNDTFTFQLCKDCYVNMKLSCKFKKQCRSSEKRFKSFLRLKEISDIDLCTFLKNSDDTLKFPLLSGCSTPANQRNKDDDNESTCTSIQNFMTDILQGTEMPDTEARIIKEVIEEEADVLEESLDSHWLQDDVSIDTDFRLDFSFSPFSTSRSVNNDHCYTPRKQIESRQNTKNDHVKKVLEQLPTLRENGYDDSPKENTHAKKVLQQLPTLSENYEDSPKDISLNGINEALRDICGKSQIDIEEDYMQDNLIEVCVNANEEINVFETDPNMPELGDETDNNFPVQNKIDMAVKNIIVNFETRPEVNKKNFYVQNDLTMELEVDNIVKHQAEHIVLDNSETVQKNMECSIDKKLKQALENNNKVIQLDDLLESPAGDFPEATGVSMPVIEEYPTTVEEQLPTINDFHETIGESTPRIEDFTEAIEASTPNYADNNKTALISTPRVCSSYEGAGASTPIINNILFGEKLELNDDHNNDDNVGQCIEKNKCITGDIDILEVFFKEEVKEIDENETSEVVATELNGEKALDFKEEVAFDNSKYYDIEKNICKICNKECANERAIKCHIYKIHKIKIPNKKWVDIKPKLCPYCSMEIKSRGNFLRHLRTHEKIQKEYKCDVCTLTYSTEWKLRQHAKAHNISLDTEKKEKKNKFICSTCGASFALSCNLNAHARRHEEPALACRHCGARFHRNYELQRHERTHTGDRPHVCPVPECRRSFAQKYGLVLHMTKHTAEKPYQCDYCSSKFSKKWSLVNHIHKSSKCKKKREGVVKNQKRIKQYKCYFCNRQYSKKGHLIKHQEKSASCVKKKEDLVNLNRSTLKIQMPFLYPDARNVTAPMTKRVRNEQELNTTN